MSCRVLGRKVEHAVLNRLAADAKREGAESLAGAYIPTPKNKLVEQHYERLGFQPAGKGNSGCTQWVLGLSDYVAVDVPMIMSSH
jgi:predicted enzyme involved in methoxymalonyl-ACP biosynthesis